MQSNLPRDFDSKTTKEQKAALDPADPTIYSEGQKIISGYARKKGLDFNKGLGETLLKIYNGNKQKATLLFDELYDLILSIKKYDSGRYEDIRSKSYPKVRKPYIQVIELINSSELPENIRLGIINAIYDVDDVYYRMLAKPLQSRDVEMTTTLLSSGANPFLKLINFDNAFHILSKLGDSAYSLEENNQCIDLVIQYSMKFINDDNIDVFIKAIKEAITPKKSAESKLDSSFEFTTAFAHSIEMKRIPVRYLVKLLQNINIDEYPALWPALKEVFDTVKHDVKSETGLPPALATIVTDYLTGELKKSPASEMRDEALVNHVYRTTLNLINHQWSKCFNNDVRKAKIEKIMDKHKALRSSFFNSSKKEFNTEMTIDTQLLVSIKSFVEDVKSFMLGRAAYFPSIFHYFSEDGNEWKNFEVQNKFVLKEFDNILNKMSPAPKNPTK